MKDGIGVELEKAIFFMALYFLLCDLGQIIVLLGPQFPYL